MFKTVCQQEPVRRNTQCGVMMKATPVSSLVMAQAELLFNLLVVPLNAPAHFGDSDQFYKRCGSGQRRKPVLGRFCLTAWPFDQQPFCSRGLVRLSSRCAARTRSAAKRDDNYRWLPSRQFTVCQRRAFKVSATALTLTAKHPPHVAT